MKNRWTTVAEQMDAAHESVKNILQREEGAPQRSRKISIIFASVGAFLMLTGAVPFFLGREKTSEYAALMTADISSGGEIQTVAVTSPLAGESFDATAMPVEGDFELNLPDKNEEKEEALDPSSITGIGQEAASPAPSVRENTHAAAPEPEETITAAVVDFPENTHIGSTTDPLKLSSGTALHAAAPTPHNARTGTPLLPLIITAGGVALVLRIRKSRLSA